jgi:two-component sensor histidine kinase
MGNFNFYIDLPVKSEWSNVDLLRTSVQSCFSAVFSDIEGCHALAMVTGELLENAIKYGDWSGEDHRFRLRVWGEGNRAHVSVENPIKSGDTGATEVIKTLGWMGQFTTPDEAYRARLLEIAEGIGANSSTSKLGLVRIAYEGNCRLGAEVVNDSLRVTAEMLV